MTDIILHHYWQSPVAEKVRVALGLKGLTWQSVEIPRIPPKPDVIALTGGYRRTPVMQIGADVYCDSLCIMEALDRRYPDNPLFPDTLGGAIRGLSRWTDGELFSHAVRVVLGSAIDDLPEDFLDDRATLYFGSDWTKESIAAGVDQSIQQLQNAFDWMDQSLHGQFMLGDKATAYDALCYYLCWFVRGRYVGGEALLQPFTRLTAWDDRIKAVGYGEHAELSSADALAIAANGNSEIAHAPPGGEIAVKPIGDTNEAAVTGREIYRDACRVVLLREDERAGQTRVHFPVSGYVIS